MQSSRGSAPGTAGKLSSIVIASILLVALLIVFRKPATTIRSAELFTELVSRLVASEEPRSDWSAQQLDSLLAQVTSGLAALPSSDGCDLAAGLGSIYPARFLYVYEPSSSSIFVASVLTGNLAWRRDSTITGSYVFRSTVSGDVRLFLLTAGGGYGWPEKAYDDLTAAL